MTRLKHRKQTLFIDICYCLLFGLFLEKIFFCFAKKNSDSSACCTRKAIL